jgi:cyclohexadieny/prephenate dehydrogenase
MTQSFDKVTIIGMGMIGSSLARALKKSGAVKTLVGVDKSGDVCRRVEELGLVDSMTQDAIAGVTGADIVVLAVSVGFYHNLVEEIAPAMKAGAILSDVGSVKQAVVDAVADVLPESVHFVPAHPIAGNEKSGPDAGQAEMFEGRWVILTPPPETDLKAIESVTNLWEATGAVIEIMEPAHHDLILAITSHLPHLIAYTIVDTADQLEDDITAEVIKFSASGFQGFTRTAASDPTMWRDVFLNNREAVLEILQRFTEDLTAMQKAIRRGDGEFLFDTFTRTREIRRKVTELGGASVPSPELLVEEEKK